MGGVSGKEKLPSAFVVTAARALPLGDSRSVRVTFRPVPAGRGVFEVSLPVTVSFLARSAVAGAATLRVGSSFVGSVRARRVYVPWVFTETAKTRLASGAQASAPSTRVSAPLLSPVLGKSYSRVGVGSPGRWMCTSGSYQEKLPPATLPSGATRTAFGYASMG